jgi:hypothetical protein
MPTLLVSVGLLLTFVGLAIALTLADGIADLIVTPSVRRGGLRTLLDVASAKSVTSLVGLFSSILYAVFRGRELDRAERALDGFLAALEERIPLATPAILQAESNTILERLFAAQSTFRDDLAVRIGRLFDNALNHRLEDHIYRPHEAIDSFLKVSARRARMRCGLHSKSSAPCCREVPRRTWRSSPMRLCGYRRAWSRYVAA